MAKGFYSLEEAAQRLGRSVEEVKALAARGQLRQFRDRDSLMFKVDEVDALASTDESAMGSSGLDLDDSGETGMISLADTANQETGAIELADTGIQDTGEVQLADTNLGDTSLGSSTGAMDLGETGEINIADDSGEITLSGSDSGITLDDTNAESGTAIPLGESAAGSTGLDLGEPDGSTGLDLGESAAGSTGLSLDETNAGDSAISLGESAAGSTNLGLADSADLSSAGALDIDEHDPNAGSSGLGLALDDIGGSGTDLSGTGTNADGVSLSEDNKGAPREDARQATGISVFDADEVDDADPMAQTVVTDSPTQQHDEDLALDSVGSGSGLLDLTRESDDTSLGAELLDEIYPNQETAAGGDTRMDTAAGSSGVFDGAVTLEAPPAADDSAAELDTTAETAEATAPDESAVLEAAPFPASSVAAAPAAGAMVYSDAEPFDPIGSGWSTGLLMGAFGALMVALIVSVAAVADLPSAITTAMTADSNTLWMYVGIMGGVCVLFAIIGFFLGKMYSK